MVNMESPDSSAGRLLASLLRQIADELEVVRAIPPIRPVGIPIRRGRFNLGELREFVEAQVPLVAVAWSGAGCWIGHPDNVPQVGRLRYQTPIAVDSRGRMVLNRSLRAWLGVSTPNDFEAFTFEWPPSGIVAIPVERFSSRWKVMALK